MGTDVRANHSTTKIIKHSIGITTERYRHKKIRSTLNLGQIRNTRLGIRTFLCVSALCQTSQHHSVIQVISNSISNKLPGALAMRHPHGVLGTAYWCLHSCLQDAWDVAPKNILLKKQIGYVDYSTIYNIFQDYPDIMVSEIALSTF